MISIFFLLSNSSFSFLIAANLSDSVSIGCWSSGPRFFWKSFITLDAENSFNSSTEGLMKNSFLLEPSDLTKLFSISDIMLSQILQISSQSFSRKMVIRTFCNTYMPRSGGFQFRKIPRDRNFENRNCEKSFHDFSEDGNNIRGRTSNWDRVSLLLPTRIEGKLELRNRKYQEIRRFTEALEQSPYQTDGSFFKPK